MRKEKFLIKPMHVKNITFQNKAISKIGGIKIKLGKVHLKPEFFEEAGKQIQKAIIKPIFFGKGMIKIDFNEYKNILRKFDFIKSKHPRFPYPKRGLIKQENKYYLVMEPFLTPGEKKGSYISKLTPSNIDGGYHPDFLRYLKINQHGNLIKDLGKDLGLMVKAGIFPREIVYHKKKEYKFDFWGFYERKVKAQNDKEEDFERIDNETGQRLKLDRIIMDIDYLKLAKPTEKKIRAKSESMLKYLRAFFRSKKEFDLFKKSYYEELQRK